MGKRNKGKRRGQQKTAAKTEKKEARRAARVQQRYEAEIQAFLEKELADQQEVRDDAAPRPSARAHCSLVAHPSDGRTLVMFGGSVMVRGRIRTYRDLYKYRVDRGTWARRLTATMPLPRCSHQCVALRYGGRDLMYLFGGEYTTPDGEKFRHFGGQELWVCDLARDTWELVEVATEPAACPAPRSGHRMAAWGKRLVLFGGYYSAGEQTRYFNDLWLFDLDTRAWQRVDFPAGALLPDPRSGCQVTVHGDVLYVFGGFARSRPPEILLKLQAARQGRGRSSREEAFLLEATAEEQESGVYYNDVWRVNLRDVVDAAAAKEAAAAARAADPAAPPLPVVVVLWEHVRAAGKGMAPARTGVAAGAFKDRVFFFGGVCDNENYDSEDDDDDEDESLVGDSLFFNELWTFNIAKQKWFPTKMREKKAPKAKAAVSAAAAAAKEEVVPCVRYGAQAAVLGSDLYLFGGMVEKRQRAGRRMKMVEVTFDDLYRLSLSKLDGFTEVLPHTGAAKPSTAAAATTTVAPAAAAAAATTTPRTEEAEAGVGEEEDDEGDDEEVDVVPEYLIGEDSSTSSSEDEEGDDDDDEDDEEDGEEDGEAQKTPEKEQEAK